MCAVVYIGGASVTCVCVYAACVRACVYVYVCLRAWRDGVSEDVRTEDWLTGSDWLFGYTYWLLATGCRHC